MARDLCVRRIVTAAKIFALIGLLLFLFSLCSCSSSRSVMTESAATDSMAALVTAKDSVGSDLEIRTSASRYLDISDLQILFYPPADIQTPISTIDSVADEYPAVRTPKKPKILYPALLNIGRLSAGIASDTARKESTDSVGSKLSDLKHDYVVNESAKRIRDPSAAHWQTFVVVVFILLVLSYSAYMIYRYRHH